MSIFADDLLYMQKCGLAKLSFSEVCKLIPTK